MEISAQYSPRQVEDKWYAYWLDQGFFSSKPDGREPYCVVIPPPNVTGVLHMGHMLNNTIQDVLVRRARMQGKNACWVPGTDHASIATEAKVVNKLAQQGIKKTDISREEFLKHAWDWTHEHGGIILKQLRRLGCSCDWDRTAFTMDETRSKSVIRAFVDLYNKGLIYRGVRMVNWDPQALTALSDEEVIFRDEHSKLFYLRYYLHNDDGTGATSAEGEVIHTDAQGRRYAVVATTRPETIMGDTAMCINPADPKNQWLRGKQVLVPLVNRAIPVIEDSYVDIEFGTGCLKVTPAHDVNDYMLGEKHKLQSINIFNDDATISEAAGMYVGMSREEVRKQIVADLEMAGLLEKTEDYNNKVGYSERTHVPIEPKLSMQWFLKMEHLADIALKPVVDGDIKFYPPKYINLYRHWLENIKDWCISRQLWWGHQIPAYYLPEGGFVVAETPEEALQQAIEKTGNKQLTLSDLRQDDDVLDTWFSSWLWPLSLFNGVLDPNNAEFKYYYPTNDLITAPDIIFFWVARMIMAGEEYQHEVPFRNVYFTGIVRDKLGRKMSKSLGNSPDPLDLIERYGADGVRMGILLCSPAGGDLLFDEALTEQGRNFCNKIWNAFRLVNSWQSSDSITQPAAAKYGLEWFGHRLNRAIAQINDDLDKYRISEALMTSFKLFRDEFSAWLLEIVKPAYGQPIDAKTLEQTLSYFEQLLALLHPFMPFITEELWQHLRTRKQGESIMVNLMPSATAHNEQNLNEFELLKELVAGIRTIRQEKNLSPKNQLCAKVRGLQPNDGFCAVAAKLANLSALEQTAQEVQGAASFRIGTAEVYVPLEGLIDTEQEHTKLQQELDYARRFLDSVLKKLSNANFTNHAPAHVVELERKKEADARTKIAHLEERLSQLG